MGIGPIIVLGITLLFGIIMYFIVVRSNKKNNLLMDSLKGVDIPEKQKKEVIKSTEEKKWKKINSWEDVDLCMAMISGKYRIKILEELMGMEHPTYSWQQHLRRIMILGKDSKKPIEEVTDDYIKKISVHIEDVEEEKVLNEIYKETDLIKQNILIDNEIENDPNLLELYNIKAYNLYELEKVKEGIRTIMKAIKINPERAGFYDTAGEGYYMIEEYRNAVDIMSAGIEIAPEGLDPCGRSYLIEDHYYNRGMAHLKLKEYDKAKADFTHILTIEIGYEKAILALKDIPGFLSEQKQSKR